jgi:hypothetical protein
MEAVVVNSQYYMVSDTLVYCYNEGGKPYFIFILKWEKLNFLADANAYLVALSYSGLR